MTLAIIKWILFTAARIALSLAVAGLAVMA